MHAYSTFNEDDFTSSVSAPILLAASSDAAMLKAQRTIEVSGFRIAATVRVEEALDRIRVQASAAAIWIELDRDCGSSMDELLDRVSHDVSRGVYGAVISATTPLLDTLSARIVDDDVELIIAGDEMERTAALAMAIARHRSPLALSDISTDKNAERLRQLSEEVGRIASTLARLSAAPSARQPVIQTVSGGELPNLSVDAVAGVIRARRLRSKFFSEELFADPAWDMLLDLLQAEVRQLRVPVSSLCIAAAVPATTALRWLKTLVSYGLFVRRADPHDGRRVFVELAPDASLAMRRYFAEVGTVAVI